MFTVLLAGGKELSKKKLVLLQLLKVDIKAVIKSSKDYMYEMKSPKI